MKTILCSNYQKEYIYEDLAKHNHGVVANVLAVPLSVALGEKHTDKYAALLKISHTLKKRMFKIRKLQFRNYSKTMWKYILSLRQIHTMWKS